MNEKKHFSLPDPPEISDDLVLSCRKSNDFSPILFEWYKYIATITLLFISIIDNQEGIKKNNIIHNAIIIGLLNRCSRLMLSIIKLSSEGLYGETTIILDRCIFESCIKIIWLCVNERTEFFNQYLADGLRTELELEKCIRDKIDKRGGSVQIIEERMLASIENNITLSGLDRKIIEFTKKMPTLDNMVNQIFKTNPRLQYVVHQKIGSHSIHGTWPNLLKYYILNKNGNYFPKGHGSKTYQDQYLQSSFFVLDALNSFIDYYFEDQIYRKELHNIFNEIKNELFEIFKIYKRNDFEIRE